MFRKTRKRRLQNDFSTLTAKVVTVITGECEAKIFTRSNLFISHSCPHDSYYNNVIVRYINSD